ncbi:hypothetical protein HanHA89_Chr03g0111441 [Helianthus annuus]|nr:hypothetical protein HanHA89_Chr03g0111441 [Helianthus annuus]
MFQGVDVYFIKIRVLKPCIWRPNPSRIGLSILFVLVSIKSEFQILSLVLVTLCFIVFIPYPQKHLI